MVHNNNSFSRKCGTMVKTFLLPLVRIVRRLFSVLFRDLWSCSRALSIYRIFSCLSGVLLGEFIFAPLVKVLLCLFKLKVIGINFSGLWTLLSSIGACSCISGLSVTEPRLSCLAKLLVAATLFSCPSESSGTEVIFSVRPWLLGAASNLSRWCGLLVALSMLPEGLTGTVIACASKYIISWMLGPLVQGSVGFLSPLD